MINHQSRVGYNRISELEYEETCAQEYCDRKVIGGPRHRYCFEHRGMSPSERNMEARQLKALQDRGAEDKFQDW